MTTPLARAVRAVRELGGADLAERLERVDVRDDELLLEAAGDPVSWFRWRAGALTRLRPEDDVGVPLAAKLDGMHIESYRPGRRVVATNGSATVLKGYRRRRAHGAAARHAEAERAGGRGSFLVPRLLENRREDDVLVFERVAGRRPELDPRSSDAIFRLGARLRGFQEAGPCGEGVLRHGPREELAVIDRWLGSHEVAAGPPPADALPLRAALWDLAGALPPADPVRAHRDLHDGQVLLSTAGTVVLDFDLLAAADPELDAGNLLAHFSLRALQEVHGATRHGAKALADALLEGLDRTGDPAFWTRLRFYQSTSLLRLALVYGLRPRWSHLSPELVRLARRCLRDALGG